MISAEDLNDLDRVLKLYTRINDNGNGYSCGNWQIDREDDCILIFSVYYKDTCVVEYFRDRDDDTDKGRLDISGDYCGFNDEDSKKIADCICNNFGFKFDYSEMVINGILNGVNIDEQELKEKMMCLFECDKFEDMTNEEIKEWLEDSTFDDEEMKELLKEELKRRVLENDDIEKGE